MAKLMKNYGKIQQAMTEQQANLEKETVTGEAAAGAAKVTMNLKFDVTNIHVNDDIWQEDKAVVLDLIMAAHHDAHRKATEKTSRFTADLLSDFTGESRDDK